MTITRRLFLGLSATGILTGSYSFLAEPRWLRVRTYNIVTPKWPKAAKSLKIAFASDFHVGCPSVGLEETQNIVDKLNQLNADVIVLGGDYLIQGVILGKQVPPKDIAKILAGLKAPLGVYSVLGNHDWWGDGQGMWDALQNAGIVMLENNAVKIEKDGHNFWIAGLADDTTRSPDYSKIISNIDEDEPFLLIAHDPASFMEIDDRPVLTLCGHTHGGQVTIPYISPIVIPGRAPLKYAYGHIHEEGRDMIVTGGIGTSVLPVRFGRRPEIVELYLTSSDEVLS
jgi:predicted MPP superfamily phosphohydrolase